MSRKTSWKIGWKIPLLFRYLPAITLLIHSTLCADWKIW